MAELERRLRAALPVSAEPAAAAPRPPAEEPTTQLTESLPGDGEDISGAVPALAGADGLEKMAESPPTAAVAKAEPQEPLPPLDDLVKRIPPDVRTALDELFRARFTGVARATPKAAVKAAGPK